MYDGSAILEVVQRLLERQPFKTFHLVISGEISVAVTSPENLMPACEGELLYVLKRGRTYIVPVAQIRAVITGEPLQPIA